MRALISNLAHHWLVFRESMKARKEEEKAGKGRFNPQSTERQFLPAAVEVMDTPASPLGRGMAIAIIGFFTITVGWAVLGKLDIVASAQGKVIPSERVKTVAHRDGGIVRAIHVVEGQHVDAGDLLIELDTTGTGADREKLSGELHDLRLRIARLEALRAEDPASAFVPPDGIDATEASLHRDWMLSDWQAHQADIRSLEGDALGLEAEIATQAAELKRSERILPRVRERVGSREDLVRQGIFPKLDFAELEEELFRAEGEIDVGKRRLAEARAKHSASLARIEQKKAEFTQTVLRDLLDARREAASIAKELVKATDTDQLKQITAPASGKVTQLTVYTVGGIVEPAKPLMTIVPDDSHLLVEAQILNKDIGFVTVGHAAVLKVDSFPFTKYGVIDGTIKTLSADAVQNEQDGSLAYPAQITMARSTIAVGERLVELQPGMTVTVDIKTGQRRIIEYLLAPLQQYVDESMREQ